MYSGWAKTLKKAWCTLSGKRKSSTGSIPMIWQASICRNCASTIRQTTTGEKRSDYYLMSKLRMKTATGSYIPVLHRMFYIYSASHETLCLALCLYTPLTIDFPSKCIIVDSSDGHTIEPKKQNNEDILSAREKQILGFIDKGLTSKDIAELLCISINTVSRHRQGILGKLQVKNSIEACRIAKDLKII